ncbi:MAG: DUF1614 domain-containing protein [Candidatus Marsarchaeota archaeon]|nr:DUF1614 domain-containing protein [Candidatus Marsarchaeota archaeon]
MGLTKIVFGRLGFTLPQAFAILVLSLGGSVVNIPLFKVRGKEPVLGMSYYTVYGVTYPVPTVVESPSDTVVAINVGGAVIPVAISTYLWLKNAAFTPELIAGVVLITIIVNRLAKAVKGMGIVVPAFIPPIVSALAALMLSPHWGSPITFALAYVSGSLGTLIGADLLNLHKLGGLRSRMVSIGGAGTFDGVFLTGILAVLLTAIV